MDIGDIRSHMKKTQHLLTVPHQHQRSLASLLLLGQLNQLMVICHLVQLTFVCPFLSNLNIYLYLPCLYTVVLSKHSTSTLVPHCDPH